MERKINISKTQSPERREPLSYEQLGNLISTFNHEAKALTLLLMNTGSVYSRSDLFKRFIEIQGKPVAWVCNHSRLFSYCIESLAPIGLVAKEYIGEDFYTYGFAKTKFGDKLGVPFAGLMLDFSDRHSTLSLITIFSNTQTNALSSKTIEIPEGSTDYKKRAPITTYNILQRLLTQTLPIRQKDLMDQLPEEKSHSVVSHHLNRLKKNDIITYHSYAYYQAIDPTRPLAHYQSHYPTLTQNVYQIVCENSAFYLSSNEIREKLLQRYTQLKRSNQKSLLIHISSVISFLKKNSYLSKKMFDYKTQSEINLTTEQRNILTDLMNIIDRFQQQDRAILEEGRKKAEEIITDPHRVANLLHKVRTFSTQINATPIDVTHQRILAIIRENPKSTNAFIVDHLKKEYGQQLNSDRVRSIIRSLLQADLMEVKKIKSTHYFSMKKDQQQID